ncbi:hypothetical protein [Saccharothrix carnea]|uniref:hypothetical protein n=1 Tax=Saccharothrix carnea TaxID=1280637 RepID=UPI0011B22250|nr:hypothetical protein [Saccharothrix carnea]
MTVLVCAGASAGPAFGDIPAAAGPSATAPPETEPTTTAPVETSTTAPSGPKTTTGPERAGGPVTTEPSPAFVDLTLTVAFDKPEFVADEPVTARARVTNVGTAPANRVTIDSPGNVEDERYWEEIGYYGVRVEPGQTVEATFVGRVTTTEYPASMVVTIRSLDEPDVNPADNVVAISAPVTVVRGTFAGTVYADRNGDATMDAGEALADLRLEVGGRPAGSYTTKTDSAGRFLFRDLPRGNRAFDVQIPIVNVMAEEGYLRVGCSIGVHQGVATTEVAARIIGVVAPKVVGWVAVERSVSWPSTLGGPYPGAPVPNLKIYLKEWHTGAVLARAITNARGGFEFHDVPVGYYDAGVVGPWAIIFGKYLTVRLGDRLESAVTVALLGLPVAAAFGSEVYVQQAALSSEQSRTRHQVDAVLLEGTPGSAGGAAHNMSVTKFDVPATWTLPDGTARRGEVQVTSDVLAGSGVRIWVDDRGARWPRR